MSCCSTLLYYTWRAEWYRLVEFIQDQLLKGSFYWYPSVIVHAAFNLCSVPAVEFSLSNSLLSQSTELFYFKKIN